MAQVFQLSSPAGSLVLLSHNDAIPEIIYWGANIELTESELEMLPHTHMQPVPQGFLDKTVAITLLPSMGDGAFHFSALQGHNNGNAWAPQFKISEIDEAHQDQLTLTAVDRVAQLQVTIRLRLNQYNILEESIQLKNLGAADYYLENLGLSLVLPDNINQITQFHGRWIHEFQTGQSTWDQPNYHVENLRGRTSSDNPSLLMLGESACGEDSGGVYAFHLAWSGNHYYKMMTLHDGRRLVQFGEKLLPGEIVLATDETYESPTLYACFSSAGYNQISADFHRFIRNTPGLAPHSLPCRPIHFNTWEAMYFDHDISQLRLLIDRAAHIGVERFIIDDGWFRGRAHDRAGLGDWFVDQQKYPEGLTPVIEQVLARGMQCGLWFEPEMVNPDSDLYRAHPEWILQISGYSQPLGRSQYALNLANPDAYHYIHMCIHALLSTYRISYIKWDMNRDLVQPGAGDSRPGVHAHVLATYRLLAQLHAEFPGLEIESCSSGGARADLGILRYTNRIWISDCNDPMERQNIQRGFSYFFPPEIMGSHFGPEKAHTTNRLATLEYRILTSFFGHLGFEQNLLRLSDAECTTLQHYVNLYKKYRTLMHSGKFVRLDSQDKGQHCYGVINAEQTRALFAVAQNEFPDRMLACKLKISGLTASQRYRVSLLNEQHTAGCLMKQEPLICSRSLVVSGNILARLGIQLPIMHPQSILLLLIEQIDKEYPGI